MEKGKTLVVIGNGMVGHEFLRLAIERGLNKLFNIVVYSDEPYLAYDRVGLSRYIDTEDEKALSLVDEEYYKNNHVDILLNEPVVTIDRANKSITTKSGFHINYEKLVIATGASCFVPDIEGVDAEGVFVYRTLDDIKAIRAYMVKKNVGLVIGGGLLGLECAAALTKMGKITHVVELASHLMPAQLDSLGGSMLKNVMQSDSFRIHLGSYVQKILPATNGAKRVILANGKKIVVDAVVISAGIKPRNELAQACGLEISDKGGVSTNLYCETSDTNIYAIGDCASVNGRVYGLVEPGYRMAKVVVERLAGVESSFVVQPLPLRLKVSDVELAAMGQSNIVDENQDNTFFFMDSENNTYKKVIYAKKDKSIKGFILLGDTSAFSTLYDKFQQNQPFVASTDLHLPSAGLATGEDDAASENAIVCSCNSVKKLSLVTHIRQSRMPDLVSLKAQTGAGNTCGGCVPVLKRMLVKYAADEKMRHICEHFPYRRQQLYDLVKVKGYTNFREVIVAHGQGDGCDICQPLVSSILSTTNKFDIFEKQQYVAQDFNDRFLANIQRNGSYSIIPRIPGGEITSEGLIVISKLAATYKLYIRLTGGQRISLFGAQLADLPEIWKELAKHGFESGHAYGKALRTVKTCVGTTWCPWGVQDSTNFAIELEERYKGLRSPHKTKAAVSGCVRDCAEVKIKDFGVIATEHGWNLYVGGNGGRDAKFGYLLAENLSKQEVIRYTDRFLMYYIKTAEHLARTSTWIDSLDGGIDYIKEVIIEDSLGLAEGLEAEICEVLNNYECEWSRILHDEEALSRFRHYVNSEQGDDSIVYGSKKTVPIIPVEPLIHGIDNSVDIPEGDWQTACLYSDLMEQSGVCSKCLNWDVALFLSQGRVYALSNIDPFTGTSSISRGIVGDQQGEKMVITPISRKRISLETGICLDNANWHVKIYAVKVENGKVKVQMMNVINGSANANMNREPLQGNRA